jgi:ATP-dependent helicase/nuclease subunit A
MSEFTNKQQRAITSKGNILISAAAGSGKTRVLTERICQILSSGEADISEILVLTFTDAAASEMKSRIYHRLFDISNNKKDEKHGIMAEQVTTSDISTVHSFCQKVIREKYYAVGLSPSFRISSDKESKRVLKKCLLDLLEKKTSNNDKDILILYHKFGKRNGKALSDIILNLYNDLIVLPEPLEYRDKVLKAYETSDYKKRIEDILKRDVLLKLENSKEILSSALTVSKELDFVKATSLLEGYLEELDNHIIILNSKPYEDYAIIPFMKTNFSYKDMDTDVKGFFEKNKEDIKGIVDGTKKLSYLFDFEKNYDEEIKTVKQDAFCLFSLAFSLMESYQKKKTQLNFLDFSDLEHFAYKILKDSEHTKSFNYKYIFIDEYQDTNPLQEAIICRIKKEDNLFMVGDVKQSIYGFRHAEPDIFLKKQDTYKEFSELKEDKQDELIRMNDNFRSSNVVVNGINAIMENLITKDFGGIDYKNKESLVHHSILDKGKVEISLVDFSESFFESNDISKRLNTKEAEAYNVAAKIKDILGDKISVRKNDTIEEKEIDYSDIVILLRELKQTGPVYKRVLESCGIPVDCEIESDGFGIPETEVFSNLLKIISNPTDDIALLSVMKFEYFGFTSDEFSLIRSIDQNRKSSFYNCTKKYIESENNNLSKKLISFYDMLDELNLKSKCLSKEEFLNLCVTKVCFEEILSSSPKRSLKADILRGYVSSIISETQETAGLSRIVEFIDGMKKSGEYLNSSANIKSPKSVRIMTIHKSKGLEFPVVILAGIDKALIIENRVSVTMDKELGLGFKLSAPSKNFSKMGIIYQSLMQKKKLESMEESMRVLYVAMTRAENRLYLIGSRKSLMSSFSRWLVRGPKSRYFAASFLDLIIPFVINKSGFIEGFKISRFLPPKLSKVDNIKFSVSPKKTQNVSEINVRKDALDAFLNIKPKVIDIGYSYAFTDSLATPSKKSVSSLKEDTQKKEIIGQQIKIVSYDNKIKLTAAEQGTAFHVFMQHVDFNKFDIDAIEIKIKSLIEKNILTEEEAQSLDSKRILNVLNSQIIRRASKAKIIYREKNFTLKTKSEDLGLSPGEIVLIQGTIDLCFIEDDGFVVVDYKTDRGGKKIIEKRINGYTYQLDLYAKAIEKITKMPVKEKYLYFLNSNLYKV